ncbi:collagen-like protein, partial [Flavobacterium pectinovorum]
KTGIDGIPGVNGTPGTPGNPGASGSITTLDAIIKDAQGNIYAYVGSANTVKGRDDAWAQGSTDWVKINGLNGAAGIPGVNGTPGTPGNPGASGSITTLDAIIKDAQGNIYAYVGSANTVKGRDDAWAQGSADWVKINGLNGAAGIPGVNGTPGTPGNPGASGSITTLDAIIKDAQGNIYAYVGSANTVKGRDDAWAQGSADWVKINGLNGAAGIPGVVGEPGTPGNPGASGSITTLDAIIKDAQGNIYAYVGSANTVKGRDDAWAQGSADWVKINAANAAKNVGTFSSDTDSVIKVEGGANALFSDVSIEIKGGVEGQVLAANTKGAAVWQTPNILKITRISDNGVIAVTENVVLIDAAGKTGKISISLPTVGLDASSIGKVFSFKRVDTNDDARVYVTAPNGATIDDTEVSVLIGQSNTFQLILETVTPSVKWQVLSRF